MSCTVIGTLDDIDGDCRSRPTAGVTSADADGPQKTARGEVDQALCKARHGVRTRVAAQWARNGLVAHPALGSPPKSGGQPTQARDTAETSPVARQKDA